MCVLQRPATGRSGRLTPQGPTLDISPQSSLDWQQQHSMSGRLLQQQEQESSEDTRSSAWTAPAAGAAAVTAAFGEGRPADVSSEGLSFAATSSSGYYDAQSSGGSVTPAQELSFAASPAVTDGGSSSSAGGVSVGKQQQAATYTQGYAGQANSSKDMACSHVNTSSSSQHQKKGRFLKCFLLQTNSGASTPAGSGAGAPEPQRPAQARFSRMGVMAGTLQDPAGRFDDHAGQHPCAEVVHAGHAEHAEECAEGCRRESCMADDHSFCSAESVAATSWTGSCADTEYHMGMSSNGSAAGQQFPLQTVPPPPLWASPLFPPPEGYMPVDVEEEKHSHHAHFTQRVKTLRMQAAAAAAAGNTAGTFGGNCAEQRANACCMHGPHAGQEDQHSMAQHSSMLQETTEQRDRLSMPLRQKHAHHRCAEQQQGSAEKEGFGSEEVQEPVAVPGLRVKVKPSGWSADSPTSSGRIKAFFEVGAT